MKKDKLCCVICGADITRCMKIYPHGYHGGAYCYDCAEAEKKADEEANKLEKESLKHRYKLDQKYRGRNKR